MRWLALFLLAFYPTAHAQVPIVSPLQAQNLLSEIAAQGSAAQTTAQTNLGGPFLPLSGTLTYGGLASGSVATSSGTLVAAGAYKAALLICTLPTSTANIWLNTAGSAAAVNSGTPVLAGGGCSSFGGPSFPVPSTAITAITDGGVAQTVTLAGG